METSWIPLDGGPEATAKPALEHPGGESGELHMEPAHAMVFLLSTLNHTDTKRKGAAPDADAREQELRRILRSCNMEPPLDASETSINDGSTRRTLLAVWTIAEIWRAADEDSDQPQVLLDCIVGYQRLAGVWIEGNDKRTGLVHQIEDESSDIVEALPRRFAAYLIARPAKPFDMEASAKRCILCNEPVGALRNVSTASRTHGIKASAFSGRDGRHDHLASPSGDTHLCPVCLAELQLRHNAQEEFRGSRNLPPLISFPVTIGLLGALAFEREGGEKSLGLKNLNRLEI